MSISELNHFMTYVLEGWMLFSAGFISIGFISFAARRIQEDIEAEALALAESLHETEAITVEDAARLEEVAVVSEQLAKNQLAKNKGKQSDTSSVSVST
ncbi:MAG: hypothetical protein HC800_19045 [Phormidesmis sp. RL_2_1]|nr:hypothetical protein [Phormidesmis sp. RL_2_1]